MNMFLKELGLDFPFKVDTVSVAQISTSFNSLKVLLERSFFVVVQNDNNKFRAIGGYFLYCGYLKRGPIEGKMSIM